MALCVPAILSTAGRKCSHGEADAEIRIFTPAIELPFAGHPVLGTAFFVGDRTGADTVRLTTGSGLVPVGSLCGNRK